MSEKKVKYEIYTGDFSTDTTIREIEIVRESTAFIVYMEDWGNGKMKERRVQKHSSWKSYYNTWEDAHAELRRRATMKIKLAERDLIEAGNYLKKVLELKK